MDRELPFRHCEWLALALVASVASAQWSLGMDHPKAPLSSGPGDGMFLFGALAAPLIAAAAIRHGVSLWRTAGAICVLPLFGLVGPYRLWTASQIQGAPIDQYLAAIDAALGYPAVAAHHLMFANAALVGAAYIVYIALPLWIGIVSAAEAWRGHRGAGLLILSALAGGIGYGLYHLFPAVGPRVWYGGVNWADLMSLGAPMPGTMDGAPRNAFPSLHTTWAALCWLSAREIGRGWGAAGAVFLGFTLLATMGSGHHYAVDLIAAVPLVAAVWWAGRR